MFGEAHSITIGTVPTDDGRVALRISTSIGCEMIVKW